VTHFIADRGRPALELLFLDLKGLPHGDGSPALLSVSGYDLSQWNRRWQTDLLAVPPRDPRAERQDHPPPRNLRALARKSRLGDLRHERGAAKAALALYDEAVSLGPHEPSVRFQAAWASLPVEAEGDRWRERLGTLAEVRGPHGGWLALDGRRQREGGRTAEAGATLDHALGLDPLSEEAACEGHSERSSPIAAPTSPSEPDKKQLCDAVRTEKRVALERRLKRP
jgi:hypothetical protein